MPWLPDPSLLMKGRLARRNFLLLLVAAFLPVVVATWLIVGHTDTYVDEKAHQTLTFEAKRYGLGVFQRLDLAATALASAPMQKTAADTRRHAVPLATLRPYFRSVEVVDGDSLEQRIAEHASGIGAESDTITISILRDENGTNAVALGHVQRDGRMRFGVLKHDYLRQPASLAGELFVRVSDGNGRVLFASLPQSDAFNHASSIEDGDRAHWDLFLQQRFFGGKWRIDLLEPHSEVKLEFARYKRTLLFTLIPLVAALVLLASISIRRTHRPLEALTDATRRFASGEFDARVAPSGDPDTQSLALAFNGMTEQIGRQFATLDVLSRLDRQILQSSDLEDIVQTVLSHARGMLSCDSVAVLLFEEDCADIAQLHVARAPDDAVIAKTRVQVSAQVRSLLTASATTTTLGRATVSFSEMQHLMSDWQPDRVFEVHPIRTDQGAQGALLLSRLASKSPERSTIDIATGLAERMAVAISNAHRQVALVRQAHYDALTGLPNRVLFKDRLAQQIAHCHRSRSRFALLFIDLDRFKNINDSFGHTSGDELLKGVANRLVEELPGMTTIARLGGDEFTIITSDIDSARDAANAAQAVLAALARPVLLREIEHFVSASIGIAVYPQDGVSADVLLRNADIAMYRAKSAGSGRFAYYEEAMNREALERVELENDLRQAIARDELSVVYQPRIDLRTQQIIGVEALSRWRHPRFGMVPPDRFIRIAEDSGLIIAIGERVLRDVCEQYHRWRRDGVELQRLAYNVSVRQLQAPGFVDSVREVIAQRQVPPDVLEIEITESVLASDLDYLISVLDELHAMDIHISIDDFGTGYSSLSYLRRLPIDALKIDRAFLPPAGATDAPAALCEAILAMSKALNLTPIAEGVESIEQVHFLRRSGCEIAQGYYFSPPIPAADISRKYGTAPATAALAARSAG
jgi:diguanylate cyclase (GGDEF)-like protein